MAWGSTLPAAMDALLQRFATAPELDGVKVYDGPVIDGSSALEALTVGYAGEDEPTAADGQSAREGLGADRSHEEYTVRCAIEVLNGSDDAPAARRRAFELLGVVGGVLAADPRLGGAVMSAQVGTWTLAQAQTPQGAFVTLPFEIDVDAYTRR